jgi:hypothetical protein
MGEGFAQSNSARKVLRVDVEKAKKTPRRKGGDRG